MSNFEIKKYNSFFENKEYFPNYEISYAWAEHIPYAFFLSEILKPSMFVELGVYAGASFLSFCQMIKKLNLSTSCYGIDTWHGDKHSGFYSDDLYLKLSQHVKENYNDFVYLMKMTFDEAKSHFEDNSIDLLHIDGLHTYEAVKHDFENWLPKVSDKGVVIFHDTVERQRDFGVWKLWDEIKEKYPAFNFQHCHGLGTVAVGNNVNSEFIEFINEFNTKEFYQKLFYRLGNNITKEIDILNLRKELSSPPKKIMQLIFNNSKNNKVEFIFSKVINNLEDEKMTFSFNEIELDNINDITQINLMPLNDFVIMKIKSITLVYKESQKEVNMFSTSAKLFQDDIYYFHTNQPIIYTDIISNPNIDRIEFEYKFLFTGLDALNKTIEKLENFYSHEINYYREKHDAILTEYTEFKRVKNYQILSMKQYQDKLHKKLSIAKKVMKKKKNKIEEKKELISALQKELSMKDNHITGIQNSYSFRIGLIMTLPVRILKKIIRKFL